MIVDRIENASLYRNLSERIAFALEILKKGEIPKREPGRYELRGLEIYALVQEYQPKPKTEGKWEAHRKYIDVQYVSQGTEQMGWANLRDLKVTEPYSDQKDAAFFQGNGNFLTIPAGTFAIFFPEDGHMPGIATAQPEPVRKVVIKVLL